MPSNLQNFRVTGGEDRTLSMTARTAAGAILDLTGGAITWRMAQRLDGKNALEKTGTIVTAASGTFSVALTDTDTDPATLPPRTYAHRAYVTISGTTTMACGGKITIEGAIT